ncbi:MAG: hypothetical protein A3F90_13355 [Deltaproteobacteria bacterium RIFCSPLOWO2_12_FULL_60_19]|nr:MAG: hypothetical protein A3F90_13355 [Deltaproteobacteria bacterium RIFCSPLOWO2_12_FULL_60_19]
MTSAVVPSVAPETSGDAALAFLETVSQTFQRAEAAAGEPIDRFYRIGGYIVRLRFASPALLPLITPALGHLAIPPGSPSALTVCLWDSASTGTKMPSPPWSTGDYIARGEVCGYSDRRIETAFHIGADALSILDKERDLAFFWVRDARRLPYYESGAPLRAILHWWMRDHGRQLVHAGAIGTSAGGVLLVGKGGSGKSTTTLACLGSKLLYVSDDYCLLAQEPSPHAYSLYNSAKLDAGGIRRFPHLAPAISNADRLRSEKALLFLRKLYPENIASGFPVRAILLPSITDNRETAWKPASAAAALKALAPSTLFQLSGAGDAAMAAMAAVVKQVPCYHLELGTDVGKMPDIILGLLARS